MDRVLVQYATNSAVWGGRQHHAFVAKRGDVLHVVDGTLAEKHIVGLDAKRQVQSRAQRYVDRPIEPGQPLRRKCECLRDGTPLLMQACDEQTFARVRRRVSARGSFASQQHLRERLMAALRWEARRPASPFRRTDRPRSYRRNVAAIGEGR